MEKLSHRIDRREHTDEKRAYSEQFVKRAGATQELCIAPKANTDASQKQPENHAPNRARLLRPQSVIHLHRNTPFTRTDRYGVTFVEKSALVIFFTG
jgi:hypothetical protein